MKPTIIAKDKDHLNQIIQEEIIINGKNCDLNHIDVSNIIDMSAIFYNSTFNGDISDWDVSKVRNMEYMFVKSQFNGNISKWNTASVKYMNYMFSKSVFTGDISNWNVEKVEMMNSMFSSSSFIGDINNWKPYRLESTVAMFLDSNAPVPYWTNFEKNEQNIRNKTIDVYHLYKQLKNKLSNKNYSTKKVKI